MSDGSNMGISAYQAMNTIIGGGEQPTEEEKATPEQVRERVMQAPSPCEGASVYERDGDTYSLAADAIAKAFLLAEEEEPGILERREFYGEGEDIPEMLRGKEQTPERAVWNAVMKKHPEFDDWIGGASGFMVSFAFNTALYVLDKPPTPNSAIIEVKLKDD